MPYEDRSRVNRRRDQHAQREGWPVRQRVDRAQRAKGERASQRSECRSPGGRRQRRQPVPQGRATVRESSHHETGCRSQPVNVEERDAFNPQRSRSRTRPDSRACWQAQASGAGAGVPCAVHHAMSIIVASRSPPIARICTASTIGCQRAPSSHGTTGGAAIAISVRVGKANSAESCKPSSRIDAQAGRIGLEARKHRIEHHATPPNTSRTGHAMTLYARAVAERLRASGSRSLVVGVGGEIRQHSERRYAWRERPQLAQRGASGDRAATPRCVRSAACPWCSAAVCATRLHVPAPSAASVRVRRRSPCRGCGSASGCGSLAAGRARRGRACSARTNAASATAPSNGASRGCSNQRAIGAASAIAASVSRKRLACSTRRRFALRGRGVDVGSARRAGRSARRARLAPVRRPSARPARNPPERAAARVSVVIPARAPERPPPPRSCW